MIQSAATHQESDDDDDDGDRTAQRVLEANRAPLGASLPGFPLFPLSGTEHSGWGPTPRPGLLTGVRSLIARRSVGQPGWWPRGRPASLVIRGKPTHRPSLRQNQPIRLRG